MNSLKNLSDQKLVENLHGLITEERQVLIQILGHLAEICRRRLHSKLGYSSLFTFCVKELGYTESQAQRRVLAMRAIQVMPELETKLSTGKLTLATVSLVQSHLNEREKIQDSKVNLSDRTKLFADVENKSKREVEGYLATQAAANPILARHLTQQKESIRQIGVIDGEALFELKINISKRLLDKLRRIQDLSSHTGKTEKLTGLLDYLTEVVLEKIDPARISQRISVKNLKRNKQCEQGTQGLAQKSEPSAEQITAHGAEQKSALEISLRTFPGKLSEGKTPTLPPPLKLRQSLLQKPPHSPKSPTQPLQFGRRHIPKPIQREVFQKSEGCCGYTDPNSGKRCGETRYLEIDHKTPVAFGGDHSIDNLQLRCRSHNLLAAIQVFGPEKMGNYLRK